MAKTIGARIPKRSRLDDSQSMYISDITIILPDSKKQLEKDGVRVSASSVVKGVERKAEEDGGVKESKGPSRWQDEKLR